MLIGGSTQAALAMGFIPARLSGLIDLVAGGAGAG